MDPVSCLGVAAAALQFLDFSLKTIKIYRTISSDVKNASPLNAEIQDYTRRLKELASEVGASVPSSTTVSVGLVQIARRCVTRADKLIGILNSLQPPPNSRFFDKAKATILSVRNKDRIERLARDLDRERDLLVSCELAEIRQHLNRAYIQQQKNSVDIRADLNTLAIKLSHESAALRLEQSDATGIVTDKIEELSGHIATLINDQSHGIQTSISTVHDRIDRGFKELSDATNAKETCEALLRSLFFEQQYARKETVRDAHPHTFSWVHGDRNIQIKGSNLQDWLVSDRSLYWIQGKAGSGKSTLMKFIVNHDKTPEALKSWSGNRQLIVASFFFWHAGTILEKSVTGLLRSILYQICDQDRALASLLVSVFHLADGMIPTWSESRLLFALHQLLRKAPSTAICLFIDGLDEYQGDYLELLDIISDIQAEANVKICMSSRAEIEFIARLRDCPQLCLQDLNYDDISNLVNDTLREYTDEASLASTICSRAEGVFLWAALVSQDVRKGLVSGDKPDTLERRVNELPQPLHKLYSQMLAKVDVVHLTHLRFFVRTLMDHTAKNVSRMLSVALIAAALSTSDITSYEDFARECAHIKKQIVACSRGLLQISPEYEIDRKHYRLVSCANTNSSMDTHTMNVTALGNHRMKMVQSRTLQTNPVQALEEFCSCENRKISFIHRSAYEFVLSEDGVWSPDQRNRATQEEFENTFLTAYLRLLIMGPTCHFQISPRYRFVALSRYASGMLQRPCDDVHNQKFILLDQATLAYEQFPASESIAESNDEYSDQETVRSITRKLDGRRFRDLETFTTLSRDFFGAYRILDYLKSRLVLNPKSNPSLSTVTYVILGLARSMDDPVIPNNLFEDSAFLDVLGYIVEKLEAAVNQAARSDKCGPFFSLIPQIIDSRRCDIDFSWDSDRILPDERQSLVNTIMAWSYLSDVSICCQNSKAAAILETMRRIMDDLHIYVTFFPVGRRSHRQTAPKRCPRLSFHIPATSFMDQLLLQKCSQREAQEDRFKYDQSMRMVLWNDHGHGETDGHDFPDSVVCHQDLDADTTALIARYLKIVSPIHWMGYTDKNCFLSTRSEFSRVQSALLAAVRDCDSYKDEWQKRLMITCVEKELEQYWCISD